MAPIDRAAPAITTSAPGKLVLLGEYAVLEGAPGIVMAVERRARVTAQLSDAWSLTAPQLGLAEVALVPASAVATQAPADADKLAVVRAVLRAAHEAGWELPPLALHIDTAEFFDRGEKLGFGSSAAVAVALVGTLAAAAKRPEGPAQGFFLALAAHRAAQGGAGSGIDVAASSFGGLLAYHRDQAPESLAWPGELGVVVVQIGRPTSTVDYVGRVQALKSRDRRAYDACMGALVDLARCGAAALRSRDDEAFWQCLGSYHDAMARLGGAAGVDIVSAEHRRLAALVGTAGGMYKPSGAGGGDIGLIFGRTRSEMQRLSDRVVAAGFTTLPAPLAATGLMLGQ